MDAPQKAPEHDTEAGFTLLEVMIAMAILALSLVSLLGSQMESIRASRYARELTAATYLAEYQLIEIQYDQIEEGWQQNDVTYEGTFDEQERPEMKYECVVDFIELPEWNEIIEAKTDAENATDGEEADDLNADTGDQMFGAMGAVWPVIKAAIENSIRKASCTVSWNDGRYDHETTVATFWTDIEALQQLPGLGGEFTDADDDSGEGGDEGDDGGGGSGGGRGGSGGGGGRGGAQGLRGGGG